MDNYCRHKQGGNRNYGYGKQLAWAGKNALADRYGQGHYSTRATHEERWSQFARYIKSQGINDARNITLTILEQYGAYLGTLVHTGKLHVSYAQNILSTVNVVLETMRKDRVLAIKPVGFVGQRTHIRSTVPASLNRQSLSTPIDRLSQNGQERLALIALLAREFGLRFKEACLLDTRKALREAKRFNRIIITEGTKGGRNKGKNGPNHHRSERSLSVQNTGLTVLRRAAQLQQQAKNLIPEDKTYVQWRDHAYYQWRVVTDSTAIQGFHDLRAAYACERYQAITGYPAPVIEGQRLASKDNDRQARSIIAQALGHNRMAVVASYIGSAK